MRGMQGERDSGEFNARYDHWEKWEERGREGVERPERETEREGDRAE
jgi:hypothetical protein